jgi:outer membrane protein OmpA-like peptidoglycan-associated protein
METIHTEERTAQEPLPIVDRVDATGFWARAWPLLVLALIGLMLIRACVPAAAPPPSFDASAAAKAANEKALAALNALSADTPLDAVIEALNLPVVNFASGSAEIPADAHEVLKAAAQVIARLPAARLEVAGHTDNTGDGAANVELARKRAEAITVYLIASGVSAGQLVVAAYGDAKPVADNATDEGRFRNRRIEFAAAPN